MINSNQLSHFILEIIKQTRQGKISWVTAEPNDKMEKYDEHVINLVYKTSINEKLFWIYKFKSKYYHDEYDWEWIERIKFEMIDGDGTVLYEFPYEYSLNDLYNAVQEQNSGIADVIDSIFKF